MGGTTTALAVNVEHSYPHCRLAGCSKRKLSRNKTYCGNYIKFEPARQVDIKLNNLVRIIMRL